MDVDATDVLSASAKAALRLGAERPVGLRCVSGYLLTPPPPTGPDEEGPRDGFARLYLDVCLSEWIDIPTDAIRYAWETDDQTPEFPIGRAVVWLEADSEVVYSKPRVIGIDFLQGQIMGRDASCKPSCGGGGQLNLDDLLEILRNRGGLGFSTVKGGCS